MTWQAAEILVLRGPTECLTDRYSERKERAAKERRADLAKLSGAAARAASILLSRLNSG
jgi:hypothetical protein